MAVLWFLPAGIIILAAWFFYTRRLDWQLAQASSKLKAVGGNANVNVARQILRQIYKVLNISLAAGKTSEAYRAFDLLKLALGFGLARPGESSRLTAIIYFALKSNQIDAAGHGIDAFRPLIKNSDSNEVPGAIERLGLIAVICLKQRQNFLAARAVEGIFFALSISQDGAINSAAMRAIRLIGITAVRREDIGLIRDLLAKMAGWMAAIPTEDVKEQVCHVLCGWLHRAVRTEKAVVFEVLRQYIEQLADKDLLTERSLKALVTDLSQLAGTDSLNPYSPTAGKITLLSLDLAVQSKNLAVWRQAVDGTGHAARVAVSQRNLTESFRVIYPLFEQGRRLLVTELNSGYVEGSFVQQALYILIRECLQLIEFVSRQNFTTTATDIIDQIYSEWIKCQENAGQHKSIKKFCQLIFQYTIRIKRKQRRLSADGSSFGNGDAMSKTNRERLQRLGYLLKEEGGQ